MNEKVYENLMNMCYNLEDDAMSYLSDVDICDIYRERIYNDNMIFAVLVQLCTLSKIKQRLRKIHISNNKLYDMIVNDFAKEGEAE